MDQPQPPKLLGPEYADGSLEKIRAAAKGNGVKPEEIRVDDFAGHIAEFKAWTRLTTSVKTTQKSLPGKRAAGVQVGNPSAARDMIEKERLKMLGAPDIAARIRNLILERQDKGFGLKNQLIELPFLNQDFSWHEQCQRCAGAGELKCQRCFGKGQETCPRCNGQGQEHCPNCNGSQYIYDGNQKRQCPRCNGQGRLPCPTCDQRRKIVCSVCKAKGVLQCQTCGGHGWNTELITAQMQVTANFDFNREGMDERLVTAIEKLGPALAQAADFITEPGEKQTEGDDIILNYHVSLPCARMTSTIGGAPCEFLIVGKVGDITAAPFFLEHLIAPGLKSLKTGDVRTAGRYKTIRHGILVSAKYSTAKAMKILIKNTPLGFSENTLKSIVADADRALKNITAKPRRMGMIVGAALGVILYAAYFLTPLRNMVTDFVPNAMLRPAPDAIVFIAGIFIAHLCVQLFSRGAMKKALEKLMPPDQRGSLLPKTGEAGLYAGFLCAAAFMICIEMTAHVPGANIPEWYVKLRGMILK